ncbi:Flp pilus assembly protein CpaB [Acidocella aquatica]|uniref:Flp pilus assembly protein CpaB n=1 Tax=Acidocella aquatica TaxID=1922313 RepID=A0ABQ6A0C8_9PROT|nr:Flp pilus assembly protein CpaB [Acidocella aquatica]GLR65901.1 Flp pilus assembly protein CpaB [Acidocella aquatica]
MIFRLGVFGVLVVALIAVALFGFSILKQSKQQQVVAPPATEQILVAAVQLQGGSLLQPADISAGAVAAGTSPLGAEQDTPQNRAALTGAMIRTSLAPGSPILDSEVIRPGDHGFLAAVLMPGMRAVTVGVDNISGANGLIWPGDNVDVLLTQSISGAPSDKSIAAEVVLSDVRVIATGAELVKTAENAPNGGPPAQTVTLEVTQDQAARILVATNLGKLSLIVHSSQARAGAVQLNAQPAQPVWAGDVSPALANQHPSVPQVSTVKVFQGTPNEQDYSF